MNPDKCPKCGCAMTVRTDGTPYHEGKNWLHNDYAFCLEKRIENMKETISTLRIAVATAWTHGYHRGFNAENYDEAWEKSEAKQISEQK